jgi:hypothetical protein
MMLVNEDLDHLIVWWPIVQAMDGVDPRWEALREKPGVQTFPDGSLQANRAVWAAVDTILTEYRRAGLGMETNTCWRSLACWRRSVFRLSITEAYFDSIGGEMGLLVNPAWLTPPQDSELLPQELPVRVRFWQRITTEQRLHFSATIVAWKRSVEAVGVFAEGPARLLSDIRFGAKSAEFVLDMSLSGQSTLNWLTLSILNFGAKHAPVTVVAYA